MFKVWKTTEEKLIHSGCTGFIQWIKLHWFCRVQITTVDEAKQFYPLFGLGANVALIFSGRTVKYFSEVRSNLPPGVDGWAYSLKGMMGLVVVLGLVIAAIYWWVNQFVLNDPSLPKAEARKKVWKFVSNNFLHIKVKSWIVRIFVVVFKKYEVG